MWKITFQGDESCVRAFKVILEKSILGKIYNIGYYEGMEYSVKEVAKILLKKLQKFC